MRNGNAVVVTTNPLRQERATTIDECGERLEQRKAAADRAVRPIWSHASAAKRMSRLNRSHLKIYFPGVVRPYFLPVSRQSAGSLNHAELTAV